MNLIRWAVVLVIAGLVAACTSAGGDGRSDGAVVRTDAGAVRGTVHGGYRSFQAIPYAAPPVAGLRWRSPQPVTPWTGVRDATRAGQRCPQQASGLSGSPGGGAEDCLHLSVTSPRSPGAKPVMVWLHASGGGDGSATDADPHRLAVDGNVVVVTLNYRLGILGNFGYPGLAGSGGFGLQDQQAALRWVQRNVAVFGGDPGNVTLFGYSGGASAVCAHLASPPAAGLFHRVIMQSGPCPISYPAGVPFPGLSPEVPTIWRSGPEVAAAGAEVAAGLGCTDAAAAMECLRRIPAAELTALSQVFATPAYGVPVLPEDPVQVLREGRFHRMPVITGTTRDEIRFFVAALHDLAGQPVTAQSYPALLAEAFGPAAGVVAERYPLEAYPTPSLAWATLLADRVYALAAFQQHRMLGTHVPTWAYEFADQDAPPLVFEFPPTLPGGAYHGADLFSVLDPAGGPEYAGMTVEQRALADQIVRYWSTFARTGDPNGSGLPRWTRFEAGAADVQSLAPGPAAPGRSISPKGTS